ncbi:unnamed protein product, partial [Brassica oleracea var. botrytis]
SLINRSTPESWMRIKALTTITRRFTGGEEGDSENKNDMTKEVKSKNKQDKRRRGGGGLREETAENESCLADVEVKLLKFDAMIKKLSRRRPGQLIKTIAFLEDLHLYILHTYMTTVEQTVLYSFNVKARIFTQLTSKLACSVNEHTGRSVPPATTFSVFFCRANVSENERRTGLYDYQLSGCLTDQTSEYAPRGKPMEHPRFNTYHTCFNFYLFSTETNEKYN